MDAGWQGCVVRPVLEDGAWVMVEAWLPAEWLAPSSQRTLLPMSGRSVSVSPSGWSPDEHDVERDLATAPLRTEGEGVGPATPGRLQVSVKGRHVQEVVDEKPVCIGDEEEVRPRRKPREVCEALSEGGPVPSEVLRELQGTDELPEDAFEV